MDLDLTKEYPTEIYVGTESDGEFQPIKFENQPMFCKLCRKRGHLENACGRNPEKKVPAAIATHVEGANRVNHRQANGNIQVRAANGRGKGKKIWKATGRILKLDDILTIPDHVEVPIATVFETLKKDLVVAEKPTFSWDEDSKVRDMLRAVFHEDEDNGAVSVAQVPVAVINEDDRGLCSTRVDVQLLEVGEPLSASKVSKKVGSVDASGSGFSGHVVLNSGNSASIGGQDDMFISDDTMQEAIQCSVSETEAFCANKRRRGRPRKNELLLKKNGSCTVKVLSGVATRSKSLPGTHNSFNSLSNEEDHTEC